MATIADLNVNIGVSGVSTLDTGLKRASKSVGELGRETDKAADKIEKASAKTSKGFSSIGSSLDGISGAIAGAFTVGAILQFGSAVINTAASFQKMEAVLTNTLGSNSEAQNAMLMIQDIAARTPYSVEQLTSSFVKLANRGIIPTGDEIIKLADLAAASGKEFDQLSEGLLDAMTGEFERLKEFGVIASAQGDKVAFTFKGVTTEVAKTDTAIKDYVISLGSLEGVTGSVDAISATLGGQISNLGDSFTSLFKVIGEGSSGILSASVKGLNAYVSELANALKSAEQLRAEEVSKRGAFLKEGIGEPKTAEEFAAAQAKVNEEISRNLQLQGKVQAKIKAIQKEIDDAGLINLSGPKHKAQLEEQNDLLETFKRRVDAAKQTLLGLAEAQNGLSGGQEVAVTTLETLKAKLKDLQDQQEGLNVSDTKGLITKNQEIEKLQELIKKYEGLGTAKANATKFDGPKAQEIRQALPTPELDNTSALGAGIGMGIPEGFEERLAAVNASFGTLTGSVSTFKTALIDLKSTAENDIANFFTDNLGPAIDGIGNALFNAFSGPAPGKEFFNSLIKMFAQAAAEYGKLTMALGVAKVAVGDLSGIGAIAAGAALIAAAGVASGMASRSSSGSGGGISGGGGSYSPPTNNARANGYSHSGPAVIIPETRISGSDIVISYERAKAQNNRRG